MNRGYNVPKLSILLPTYNGGAFLAEQLESIANQDDPDFELLAIDDGSDDGTRDVLAAFAAAEPRLRVLPSTGNMGQNLRLLELLKEATGSFIAISDQDDRWAADRNSRLFAAMEGRTMALGRSELIDGGGAPIGLSLIEKFSGILPGPRWRLRALLEPMFSAHATITRRDRVNVGAFSHPLPFDWLMALEALFADGLAYDDGAVVYHRIHGGNQLNRVKFKSEVRYNSSHLKWMFLYRRSVRLNFWLALDYLSRSEFVGADKRSIFKALAGRCRIVWFSEWRAVRTPDGGISEEVARTLRPWAGSDEDWRYFSDRIAMLTAAPGSLRMFRDVIHRVRHDPSGPAVRKGEA